MSSEAEWRYECIATDVKPQLSIKVALVISRKTVIQFLSSSDTEDAVWSLTEPLVMLVVSGFRKSIK